jgi:hypothetical protein
LTKQTDILEEMRKGTPWEQLDQSSRSSFYKSYDGWISEAEPKYKEFSEIIRKEELKKKQLVEANAELEARHTQNLAAINSDEESLKAGTIKLEKTSQAYTDAKTKHDTIQVGLTELKNRGITESLITKLVSSDVSSSEDLLNRVETKKNHEGLLSENESLVEQNADLVSSNAREAAKKEKVTAERLVEENARDKIRRENVIYTDVIELIFAFLARGYDLDLLRSLLGGLKKFEVNGKPRLSIQRFLSALAKLQIIEDLDALIIRKTAELDVLKKEVERLKGIIDAYRSSAISAMQGVIDASTQRFDLLTGKAVAALNSVTNATQQSLTVIQNTAGQERAIILRKFNEDAGVAERRLHQVHQVVEQSHVRYNDKILEWEQVIRNSAHLENQLQQYAKLLASTKDSRFIGELPPETILSLLKTIDFRIQMRLQNTETLPSKQLAQKEMFGFSSLYKVKVVNLSTWLLEECTKQFFEGKL